MSPAVLRVAVIGAMLAGTAAGVPTAAASAADGPASVVDDRAYPGADEIFAEHGVRVLTGDGNIRYAPDCASDPDLFRVERLVGSTLEMTCFAVRGPRGFLTLELRNAYLVRGAGRTVTATSTRDGETDTVTVAPHQYEAIGDGDATHTLVELRVAEALPAGETSAHPYVARVDTADGRACSGVLIARQWIATTRTCLHPDGDVDTGAPPQATTVTVGRADVTRSGGHSATVTEVVPRTDRDVVLAKLSEPAPETFTPVPVASASPAAGSTVLAAGYGRSATDWTSDRMRTGAYIVGGTTATTVTLQRAAGTATSTCKGDAGGPALRDTGDRLEVFALHVSSWQTGCHGASATSEDAAVEARVDDLGAWITAVIQTPGPVNPLRNLFAGAPVTASSSTEGWGWALRQVNDGVREGLGWSSLDPPDPSRPEWIEFQLAPGGILLNRIDLYPRSDGGAAGFNFPADFSISVYHLGAWRPALSRSAYPNPGNKPQRFLLPGTVRAEKIRIAAPAGRLLQFAEIEAYRSDNLLADAAVTTSSSTEGWGWSVRYVNDGRREGVGWSSLDPPSATRTEWIEFALPEARPMNRVDLYPRTDNPGGGFPSDFTVESYRDGQWHALLTQTGVPSPGATPRRFTFAPQPVQRLRIRAGAGRLLQFAEIEAHRSDNLLADAAVSASSSTEAYGWSLRYANDGVSAGIGWSSLDPPSDSRPEWIEFAFPGPRTLNQVDLYPRSDTSPGGGFPADFMIQVFRDGQWHTVLSRTGHPYPGVTPQRFRFAAQPAERVRILAGAGRLLQFAEITAQHI